METTELSVTTRVDDNRLQVIKTTTVVVTEDYIYDDVYDKIQVLEQQKAIAIAEYDRQITALQVVLSDADNLAIVPVDNSKTLTSLMSPSVIV